MEPLPKDAQLPVGVVVAELVELFAVVALAGFGVAEVDVVKVTVAALFSFPGFATLFAATTPPKRTPPDWALWR